MNAKRIAEIINKSNYNYFGLRMMTLNHYSNQPVVSEVGQIAQNSYHWDNNESTGIEIDGTCAIEVSDEESIKCALSQVKMYDGRQVALLGSNSQYHGDDENEVILRDAEILAIWNK